MRHIVAHAKRSRHYCPCSCDGVNCMTIPALYESLLSCIVFACECSGALILMNLVSFELVTLISKAKECSIFLCCFVRSIFEFGYQVVLYIKNNIICRVVAVCLFHSIGKSNAGAFFNNVLRTYRSIADGFRDVSLYAKCWAILLLLQ